MILSAFKDVMLYLDQLLVTQLTHKVLRYDSSFSGQMWRRTELLAGEEEQLAAGSLSLRDVRADFCSGRLDKASGHWS
ncbi:hypothetical protein IRJ41_016581 [Triplophysa rosa]|uniref:Uncharacterized protein n=1 Tax=Triplophysa rosa TaxID=992332 RepID=A0A9W7WZX7_TRIRA|nr:hypothetical protein IRJ41_016581 [Triplophysa rosa]